MAGELIIRYWPVDGSYQPAGFNSFNGGVTAEVQVTPGAFHNPDAAKPTMIAPGYTDWDKLGDNLGSGQYSHAGMVYQQSIFGTVEGQFVEMSFTLLDQTGAIVPVLLGSLPMDVYLVGMGPSPSANGPSPSIWSDGWPGGRMTYAGGALQLGVYDDATFVELGVVWVDGGFFNAKPDGASFANPLLPKRTTNVTVDPVSYALVVALQPAALPASIFWTQLRRSVETP